jgi:hypothetical protein
VLPDRAVLYTPLLRLDYVGDLPLLGKELRYVLGTEGTVGAAVGTLAPAPVVFFEEEGGWGISGGWDDATAVGADVEACCVSSGDSPRGSSS